MTRNRKQHLLQTRTHPLRVIIPRAKRTRRQALIFIPHKYHQIIQIRQGLESPQPKPEILMIHRRIGIKSEEILRHTDVAKPPVMKMRPPRQRRSTHVKPSRHIRQRVAARRAIRPIHRHRRLPQQRRTPRPLNQYLLNTKIQIRRRIRCLVQLRCSRLLITRKLPANSEESLRRRQNISTRRCHRHHQQHQSLQRTILHCFSQFPKPDIENTP